MCYLLLSPFYKVYQCKIFKVNDSPPLTLYGHALVKSHTILRLRVVTKLYGISQDAYPCKVKLANKWLTGATSWSHQTSKTVLQYLFGNRTCSSFSCHYHMLFLGRGGGRRDPQMNKFEEISCDRSPALMSGGGSTILCDLSHDAFNVTLTAPPQWTDRRLWKHYLPTTWLVTLKFS